jgi:hypothetical protein
MYDSGQKQTLALPNGGKSAEVDVYIPDQPTGIVLYFHDENKIKSGSKVNRSEFATRVLLKNGFIVVSASTGKNLIKPVNLINAVTSRPSMKAFDHLSAGILATGDGIKAVCPALANSEKIKSIVYLSGDAPLMPDNLEINIPGLFLVGELNCKTIENTQELLRNNSGSWEMKIIPGASSEFIELGKMGEAVSVAAKWLKGNLPADAKAAEKKAG